MPFKAVEHPKCPRCGKSVYAAEEMSAGGYKWHKFCFKCSRFLEFVCIYILSSLSTSRTSHTMLAYMCPSIANASWCPSLLDMCNKLLDSLTAAEHLAELYCRQCHGRKYGPKGVGFGIGAGALTMDTGEQFGNREVEMTFVFLA